jgi:hypothetical protein
MVGSLIFHSLGSGWQIVLSEDGVGGSMPFSDYARPGKLSAICDDSDMITATFVGPGGGGGSVSMTLNCGCNPP